jgi:hypothetical protein
MDRPTQLDLVTVTSRRTPGKFPSASCIAIVSAVVVLIALAIASPRPTSISETDGQASPGSDVVAAVDQQSRLQQLNALYAAALAATNSGQEGFVAPQEVSGSSASVTVSSDEAKGAIAQVRCPPDTYLSADVVLPADVVRLKDLELLVDSLCVRQPQGSGS